MRRLLDRAGARPLLGAGLSWILACGLAASAAADEAGERRAEPRTEALRSEGARLYEAKRYFDAAAAFEKALARAATDAERAGLKELLARSLSAHGVELFNAGESRRAEKAFRDALERNDDFYAHFGLGFFHLVRLEDAEAERHLTRALALEPGYQRTHKLMALLDYRQGRTAAALKRMEEACTLEPGDKEAQGLLERWRTEVRHAADFRETTRGSFVVRADPKLRSERVAAVVRLLEKAHREVGEALFARSSRRVVVVLFDEADFHRATGSLHWVGGLYDGQLKLPLPAEARAAGGGGAKEGAAAVPAAVSPDLEEVLRHEITHVLIREISAECPNWLNEGIAQHFERRGRGAAVEKELRAGKAPAIPLAEIPARLWDVEREEVARQAYLEGLAFVEFLVAKYQEFRLGLLLDAIREHGSLERAFEVTYGARLAELEAAWWRQVEGGGK